MSFTIHEPFPIVLLDVPALPRELEGSVETVELLSELLMTVETKL